MPFLINANNSTSDLLSHGLDRMPQSYIATLLHFYQTTDNDHKYFYPVKYFLIRSNSNENDQIREQLAIRDA